MTEELLDTAIRITELHAQSLCSIGDGLAENKDMRDRRRMLFVLEDAGSGATMTLGQLLRATKMLKRRGREILETLMEEKVVAGNGVVDGEVAYAITQSPGVVSAQTVPESEEEDTGSFDPLDALETQALLD
jgi:hypothetical protein